MKRGTRTILLTVFVLIALLVSAGILLRPKPPLRYQGKTVYEWLVLLDPNVSQAASHDQARLAFVSMGKSALPDLEKLLSEKPNRFSERIRNYLVGFRLLRPKPLTVHEQEHRASRAAYILAEDANVDIRRLIPHLVWWYTNSNYAVSENTRALARAGSEGIAVLTNLACGHPVRYVRDDAAWALHLVPNAPGTAEALIRIATSEPDPKLRANAFLYLPRSRGPTNVIVPLGIKGLASQDPYQRWTAADLLSRYVVSDEVRAAFERALSDSDERVRKLATNIMRH